ncbi:hypothetical protein N7495_002301 [Penicillium taxi]|uniref:uncharacterized protein n=1 Tax=Penicillium taxi TaxID=168475 RepID=UPI002545B4A2|nr:uncharacterized protein N7495_002301 [Penicillium taxi]KAJ5901773.1 hypothetical protein N7495_002301 [Penicillium taxi]
MKRLLKKETWSRVAATSSEHPHEPVDDDLPEAIIIREIITFCENSTQGNEFVHLPSIVEVAESSPAAAKEAARRIRKYLSTPSIPNNVQYNAVMLMRILSDNPGHTFTRNMDNKFVTAVESVLTQGRDWHLKQYLREYLDNMEANRPYDEDLELLLKMWANQKVKERNRPNVAPQLPPRMYANPTVSHGPPSLPGPGELSARVEEAKNSAKLLTQFVEMTPLAELEVNELVKEFMERCQTSSRLLQSYIHAQDPSPDEETLLTLIDTNDTISVALSQQQRAMLKARKARASNPTSNVTSQSPFRPVASGAVPAPLAPQTAPEANISSPSAVMSGGRSNPPPSNAQPYQYNAADFVVQNPYADSNVIHDASHPNASSENSAAQSKNA